MPRCIASLSIKEQANSINIEAEAYPEEWNEHQCTILHEKLSQLAKSEGSGEYMYIHEELTTGMSEKLIDQIVSKAHLIRDQESLCALCSTWGNEEQIMSIIDNVRDIHGA